MYHFALVLTASRITLPPYPETMFQSSPRVPLPHFATYRWTLRRGDSLRGPWLRLPRRPSSRTRASSWVRRWPFLYPLTWTSAACRRSRRTHLQVRHQTVRHREPWPLARKLQGCTYPWNKTSTCLRTRCRGGCSTGTPRAPRHSGTRPIRGKRERSRRARSRSAFWNLNQFHQKPFKPTCMGTHFIPGVRVGGLILMKSFSWVKLGCIMSRRNVRASRNVTAPVIAPLVLKREQM